MRTKHRRLGDILVEAGVVTKEQVEKTVSAKRRSQKLGDALLEHGLVTETQLIEVLEFQLGIPHVTLSRHPVDSQLTNLVPKDMAKRHLVLPFQKEGDKLRVAMADPMDYVAIDDLRMHTGFSIEPSIASKKDIQQSIYKYYELEPSMKEFAVEETEEEPAQRESQSIDEEEDAPVIRLVNQLFAAALQKEASDVHVDPHETKILVRYRIDGILRTEQALPKHFQNALVARVKIMANLNITETRLPQDGRVKVSMDKRQVDLRISTLPTVYGEKIVVRILDMSQAVTRIGDLGFNIVNKEHFENLLSRPSGMVLITGPTGSGKTSTLYAGLNALNDDEVNIMTIEDPVEYQMEGINQVQVNAKVGLTFAAGLRSMLRQDPNIVMVGEIRDRETAEIAVRASLTGHLVMSTLHTNSALSTIPRLIDMGVEPFLVMSSLTGVVAQRLVRRVCPECSETYEPTEQELKWFVKRGIDVDNLYRGRGCKLCNDTGYKGRMAIHEVLVIDDELRKLVLNNKPMTTIKEHVLKNDMIFLIEDGLLKAKKGETTLEEVLRVALDD
ncbi:GspE/PulE family protein [Alteribacter keqinensis]|uniref:Type II secretion system protein GspE n=1 Tax=Alteribacter keqinensis TaxID=2483800 RepID=A0A3M7TX73_9BACI|nr:ATPase, T2SS/T4P/T4SS family [Alteribacter keqinensis]RNA70220.1 type II secretion system protein GspE [Alteribacter keqinensis]